MYNHLNEYIIIQIADFLCEFSYTRISFELLLSQLIQFLDLGLCRNIYNKEKHGMKFNLLYIILCIPILIFLLQKYHRFTSHRTFLRKGEYTMHDRDHSFIQIIKNEQTAVHVPICYHPPHCE